VGTRVGVVWVPVVGTGGTDEDDRSKTNSFQQYTPTESRATMRSTGIIKEYSIFY
jgi:hypothetical protein